MNNQCHECKIRKLCYLEEPEEDWTCDHYEPCEYDEEDATDINVGDKLGTNLAEVGTDCISRQALLDKFEPWLKVKDYNDDELNMLKAVLYEIRFMRPAQPKLLQPWEVLAAQAVLSQPEIIRCKDCRHRDEFGCCKYWVGLTMGMPTTATDDDDFCSHAERSKT